MILIGGSVVCHYRGSHSFPRHSGVVRDGSRWRPKNAGDRTRPVRGFDVDLTVDGHCQEFGWEA